METDDGLRSMRDPAVRERRKAMLHESHIEPLTFYAARLREGGVGSVPEFDPFDGGVNARILFLFEKPGPMTVLGMGKAGSGFISRNNDDPTAEATFSFMRTARIDRKLTVTWNLIPWWNGTRKVTGPEVRAGLEALRELIALLPGLRTVVLVGRNAAAAEPFLKLHHPELSVLKSAHPSPLVRAKFPDRWNAIPQTWAKILR
jgi:hypothetical protein